MNIFRKLTAKGSFNAFIGAGISRNPPTCAPIWREFRKIFISALFTEMKKRLVYALIDEEDKADIIEQQFRPEQFWEFILNSTSHEFVTSCLKALSYSIPNESHHILAKFYDEETISTIITPNFDEYIENCVTHNQNIVVKESDYENVKKNFYELDIGKKKIIFKIHGTLSQPLSMDFTLAHLGKLPTWKESLLTKYLNGMPFLIAGYSGYDEDILPVLSMIIKNLPYVVIFTFPGSPANEPIKKIAKNIQHIDIIETSIHDVLSNWAELAGINLSKCIKMSSKEQISEGYHTDECKEQFSSIELNIIEILGTQADCLLPLITSSLFYFSGHRKKANKYSEIAFDVAKKEFESGRIDGQMMSGIVVHHMHTRSTSGLSKIASMEIALVSKSISLSNQSVMTLLMKSWSLILNPNATEGELKEAELWASGIYQGTEFGLWKDNFIRFRACWCLGRLNDRYAEEETAIAYYYSAEKCLIDDIKVCESDYIMGAFLLDFGSSLVRFCVSRKTEEGLSKAHQIYAWAESIARKCEDYITLSQSLIMLSKIKIWAGKPDDAINYFKEAKIAAEDTGDKELQKRVKEHGIWIDNCCKEFGWR